MAGRLVAVLGALWMVAFFPGVLASPLTSSQQLSSPGSMATSPGSSSRPQPAVTTQGEGRQRGGQTGSTALASPHQHPGSKHTSTTTSRPTALALRNKRSEPRCSVYIGRGGRKKIIDTKRKKFVLSLISKEDFLQINVELTVKDRVPSSYHISDGDLCLQSTGERVDISFEIAPVDHFVKPECPLPRAFRFPSRYTNDPSFQWRVEAQGSSCWTFRDIDPKSPSRTPSTTTTVGGVRKASPSRTPSTTTTVGGVRKASPSWTPSTTTTVGGVTEVFTWTRSSAVKDDISQVGHDYMKSVVVAVVAVVAVVVAVVVASLYTARKVISHLRQTPAADTVATFEVLRNKTPAPAPSAVTCVQTPTELAPGFRMSNDYLEPRKLQPAISAEHIYEELKFYQSCKDPTLDTPETSEASESGQCNLAAKVT